MSVDRSHKILSELFELAPRAHVNISNGLAKTLGDIKASLPEYEPIELTRDAQEVFDILVAEGVVIDPHTQLKPGQEAVQKALREIALNVSDGDVDKPIRVAFQRAGLDVHNPLHWRLLIWMFSRAHFGARTQPGAPRFWTTERYCDLLSDIWHIKAKKPMRDKDACRVLLKTKPYGRGQKQLTVERLRKALREARDPKLNSVLAMRVQAALQAFMARYEQDNKQWTSQIQRECERKTSKQGADWIGQNWIRT